MVLEISVGERNKLPRIMIRNHGKPETQAAILEMVKHMIKDLEAESDRLKMEAEAWP